MPSPSPATAERWNRALRGFRFFFAHGGHANDMDTLSARIRFTPGEEGLAAIFLALEVPLQRIPPGAPRVEAGRSYTVDVWRWLPEPIAAYPDYAQPRDARLYGRPAMLSVYRDWIAVYACGAKGSLWEVTEKDFENALHIEVELARRGVEFILD